MEGTVTWTRVGSGHLPARVLILEHLIGARDNNVGGSDVSPCRRRGICCTSFCVRSPLRNLLLSAAKLWRATVRSIDRALLCCKRAGDTHSRHRGDRFNISASRHFSHSATANSERRSDLLVHKISPAHPGAIKSTGAMLPGAAQAVTLPQEYLRQSVGGGSRRAANTHFLPTDNSPLHRVGHPLALG